MQPCICLHLKHYWPLPVNLFGCIYHLFWLNLLSTDQWLNLIIRLQIFSTIFEPILPGIIDHWPSTVLHLDHILSMNLIAFFFWLRSHTLWSNGMPLDLITSLHVLAGSMVRHFVGCVHLMVRSWHLLFHQCASGLLSNLKRCICTNDLLHHLYHTTIKFTYLFNCVTSIHQASIDCLCICSNSSYFFRASWVWGELGNQSNCNHVGII